MNSDHIFTKMISLFIWYSGIFVLSVKGWDHFHASWYGGTGPLAAGLAVSAALIMAVIRGRKLFSEHCRRNLMRIDAMENPRIYHAFSPSFFLALAAMMAVGMILSRLAEGHPFPQLAVAFLDWTLALSLLISSKEFYFNMTQRLP